MSLINKMLRDLDARNAVGGKAPLAGEVRAAPDVANRARFSRGTRAFLIVAALAFVALQFSDFWLPRLRLLLQDKPTPMPRPVPPPAPVTPPSAPVAPAAQPPAAESLLPLPPLSDALTAQPEAAGELHGGLKLDTALAREPSPLPAATPAQPTRDAPRESPRERPKAAASTARVASGIAIDSRDPLAGDRAEAEYRKGVNAFRQGHQSEAMATFRGVLREDPRHLGARQALLGLLAEARQWDEAQSLLKDGLAIMPTHYLWAMALARIQVERGSTAAALETMQQHIAYAEKRAEYQGFTGVLLQRLQRPREAAGRFQAATQLKPSEGRWWLGLGMALEADGRWPEAREAYLKAQAADGMTPETLAFTEGKLKQP